jgi:hypothetical protein
MIAIYGWLKEKRPIKPLFSCYCYVCQCRTDWHLLWETEWVTFFGMRTLPFMNRNSIACPRCEDEVSITSAEARTLCAGSGFERTVADLEKHQLSSKSDVQRNFLLAARAAREDGRTPA